jgi:hypothetical protein
MATIETCGGTTDFDTVLYIRTSCLDPNPPSEVGCNNDTCGLNGRASRITMMVTAGTPYFIFVDGVSGAAGHYTLTVTPPAGTCINPYIIPPEGGTFPGTTSGVSGQASTITCGGGGGGPEKVYQWTPSASGVAAIDTCDGTTPFQTNFITVLYIRSESPDCDTGVEVACDSGSCGVGGVGSQIMPTVNEGTSYFIFVDGFTGDDAGNYTLRVSPPSTITTTTTSTTTTTT